MANDGLIDRFIMTDIYELFNKPLHFGAKFLTNPQNKPTHEITFRC